MLNVFMMISVLMLGSCVSMPLKSPVLGAVYTKVNSAEMVTSNSLGKKTGKTCARSILGLIATGDASIQTAARNANISKISHVDSEIESILGVLVEHCTVVYGE